MRLVEELRIGAIDGDPAYLMGNVTEIAVATDGTILVHDRQGPIIRAYDPQGRFIRDIGGAGDGPGEYRGVVGMGVNPDGELVVYDVSRRRVTFYDRDGEYSRLFPTTSSIWGGDSFRLDSAGNFIIVESRPTAAEPVGYTPDGRAMYDSERPGGSVRFYVRWSPSGEALDTIPVPKSLPGPAGPFEDGLEVASTPDGSIVWGNRRRYELNIRISADSLLRIEREFAPLRVPGAEREQWLARIRYVKRQSPNSLDAAWVVSEEKPSFKALSVGDDGRIWVQRFVEGDDGPPATQSQTDQPPRVTWREKPTFDVFEGDGTFLGTVELPYGSRMFVRRGEYLWGIVPGELGESYIVRYRMEV